MKLLSLLFITWTTLSFGQFQEDHVNQLTKLNCELSDTWVLEFDIEKSFNSSLPIPNISIGLWNHKTEDGNGGNVGLSVYLFEKKFKDKVIAYNWFDHKSDSFAFLETKSYIVVLDCWVPYNEKVKQLTPVLITELKAYFEGRKDNL
jgi:hypothetical protein